MFRNETLSTLTSRTNRDRRNESRSIASVSSVPSAGCESHSGLSDRSHIAARPAMVVPRPLTYSSTTDVEDLPLILDHFSFSPGWQRHDSSMSFLTRMIQLSGKDSALIYSCRAAARSYFSNRLRTAENRSRELATYGKALTATNNLLQDRNACSRDDTALASVWLLGLHEV